MGSPIDQMFVHLFANADLKKVETTVTPYDGSSASLTMYSENQETLGTGSENGEMDFYRQTFYVSAADFQSAFSRLPSTGDLVNDGTRTYYIDRVDDRPGHSVLSGYLQEADGRLAEGDSRYRPLG